MNTRALKALIHLLEETVVCSEKPEFTCRQFLMVLYCLEANGGITTGDLAKKLDITSGGVSRNYASLGPEGSGCLEKEGKLIKPHENVRVAIAKLLDEF